MTCAYNKVTFTLPLKGLFSKHLNRDTEARSRDSITCSTFLVEKQSVLTSSKFAISASFSIKNKSIEKMLNEIGPNIEGYNTQKITVELN